ncbi:MAG: DUF3048 domain-containing protein [Anaerolineae bacterium]
MAALRIVLLLTGLALIASILGGCQLGGPNPTPTPTKTPKPPPGTSSLPSEVPTATVPPVTPTATAAAAPTLTPDQCPFTGEKMADRPWQQRRPFAIKIENGPGSRPQSGLQDADIVFEHLTEGGITRFTALFLCHESQALGPVRSGRLIDLEIPVIFHAFFAYSGASPPVMRKLEASDFAELILSDWYADPCFYRLEETADRPREHTLYSNTELLWEVAEERGWNTPQDLTFLAFSETPPTGGSPTTRIFIPYSKDYSDVLYKYDSEQGNYLRSVLGKPHTDALSGEQIRVTNVLVIYVNHVETLIIEDALGSRSVEIQLWGEGRAQLFRDGQVYEAKWVRSGRYAPLLFLYGEEERIPLKPGNTWIQVVPLNMELEVK